MKRTEKGKKRKVEKKLKRVRGEEERKKKNMSDVLPCHAQSLDYEVKTLPFAIGAEG